MDEMTMPKDEQKERAMTTNEPAEASEATVVGQVITQRILVALDRSPHSTAALRTSARLAARLQVELHGLFVEDDRLLRLCNSPFSREIGLFTAAVRPLESLAVERTLRVMAAELRQQLAYVAAEAQVQWHFHVRRGVIEQILLAEAENVLMLGVGRTNRYMRRGLGTTARRLAQEIRHPLLLLGQQSDFTDATTVVYDGSQRAQRALTLALQLHRYTADTLTILLLSPAEDQHEIKEQFDRELSDDDVRPKIIPTAHKEALRRAIRAVNGMLILPVSDIDLVVDFEGPTLLIP